jgi:ribosome-associated protein
VADTDLRVTSTLSIPRAEVLVRFSASGGPGGQHANKAATRVELTFDAATSPSLSEGQRNRILDRIGPVVRIVVDDERSQTRNRELAEARFVARLAAALHVEVPRRPTRPSRGAKQRRLDAKKQRSETKANRRRPGRDA